MAGKTLAALSLVAVLVGCGSSNVVDGKAEVDVTVPTPLPTPLPTSIKCYLLEVEVVDASGEEVDEAESYRCVTREEYNKNRVGDEWVDANGKKIGVEDDE